MLTKFFFVINLFALKSKILQQGRVVKPRGATQHTHAAPPPHFMGVVLRKYVAALQRSMIHMIYTDF